MCSSGLCRQSSAQQQNALGQLYNCSALAAVCSAHSHQPPLLCGAIWSGYPLTVHARAGRATAVAIGVEAEVPGRGRGRRTGRTGPRQPMAAAVAVVEGRVVAAAAASGAATPCGPAPMDLALAGWTPNEEEKLIEGAKLWPA